MKVSSMLSTDKGIFLILATSLTTMADLRQPPPPKLLPPRHRWCSMSKRHVTEIKIHLLNNVTPFHQRQQQHRRPLPLVMSASWRCGEIQHHLVFIPYVQWWCCCLTKGRKNEITIVGVQRTSCCEEEKKMKSWGRWSHQRKRIRWIRIGVLTRY